MPTPDQERALRRGELELSIDYRLGRNFPPDRRAALWEVQQRIEKRRLRLALGHLWRRFFSMLLQRDAGAMAAFAADEYSKVLSEPELRRFLDLNEGEQPALPAGVDHFRR